MELSRSSEASSRSATKEFSSILWHIDPLLGNDSETNNETTAFARLRPAHNNGSTVGGGVFYVVRSEAISHDRPNSVSAVQCSVGK
jgi:hypothetical protein